MAAPIYLYDILSVHNNNPGIPATLDQVDMNRAIRAGDVIARQDLVHARAVADLLKGIHMSSPLVTDEVVESAELRAKAVEIAHTMAQYPQVNILNVEHLLAVINNRLDNIEVNGARTSAAAENIWIIARNSRLAAGAQNFEPLEKTGSHGLALAQVLAQHLDPAVQEVLTAPVQAHGIGTKPPNFNANVFDYHHADIVNMIIFYNDSFGIRADDTVGIRIAKFQGFLSEF